MDDLSGKVDKMDWKAELTQIAQNTQGADDAQIVSRLRFDELMHKQHATLASVARRRRILRSAQ